jgi:hypothetical protein
METRWWDVGEISLRCGGGFGGRKINTTWSLFKIKTNHKNMYRVSEVLPPERKHPLLINLKFSKNSVVEQSVKFSKFLMKQLKILF